MVNLLRCTNQHTWHRHTPGCLSFAIFSTPKPVETPQMWTQIYDQMPHPCGKSTDSNFWLVQQNQISFKQNKIFCSLSPVWLCRVYMLFPLEIVTWKNRWKGSKSNCKLWHLRSQTQYLSHQNHFTLSLGSTRMHTEVTFKFPTFCSFWIIMVKCPTLHRLHVPVKCLIPRVVLQPFHSWAQKVHSPNLLKRKCISGVARICIIIIFHLSKLWKAKFSLLCDVIFLLRLQEKFDIDHSGVKGLSQN